jgi:ABC-type antimicrobial peptide transport system permease subunit
MRMVLTQASALVVAGLAIGLPIAFWGKRLAAATVANLASGGVRPMAEGMAAMIAVALVAAYVPVRRATRVDPVIALRSE